MPVLDLVKNRMAALLVVGIANVLVACSTVETKVEQVVLVPKNFTLNLRDNTPGSTHEFGKIHLEYVQLTGWSNLAAEDKINQDIRQIVGMENPYDGSEDLILKVKKAEIADNSLHFMVQGTYYKHGAANGHERISSAYFDLATGERIRLADVLKPGFKDVLNAQVKIWLEKQNYANLFEGIGDDQCFYHDAGILYLCFSEYEVAPGAAGIVNVPISITALDGLIRSKGLLAQ